MPMKFIPSTRGQSRMHPIFVIAFAAAPLLAFAADDEHVNVSLLSEQAALVPGKAAWLGVRLEHAPHWHTYWINPGDSGLPTKLSWELPPGFHAGEIAWPAPTRIRVGDLYNFGYEGDMLLPVSVDVPADAQPGTTVHIGAEAKWLICREECIPGKTRLALEVPVGSATAATARNAPALFDAARSALPQPAPWQGAAHEHDDKIEITLHGADLPTPSDALLVQRKIINYTPPQISNTPSDVTIVFAKSDYFTAAPSRVDLVLRTDAAHAWSVSVPFSSHP
jgi:thiol:disulfide interchange protein DsbD